MKSFPVDDLTLDALEHALGGAYDVDEDGTHHLVGADYSLDQFLDFVAGIDPTDASAVEVLDPGDPTESGWAGAPVYIDNRPHYHPNDVIRSLIAEVRRLRLNP